MWSVNGYNLPQGLDTGLGVIYGDCDLAAYYLTHHQCVLAEKAHSMRHPGAADAAPRLSYLQHVL